MFGYAELQKPLEALIIAYPVVGLQQALARLPEEAFSKELAPSISKIAVEVEKQQEESGQENQGDQGEDQAEDEEDQEDQEDEEDQEDQEDQEDEEDEEDETSSYSSEDPYEFMNGGDSSSSSSELMQTNVVLSQGILTGMKGLRRMMKFEESDIKKGDFEYRSSTLSTYGPIFAHDVIGQYSAKIKCVLNCIRNPDTKRVSEGILLIYSQYLESGLIPMALALEQMGFSRFGENTQSLFRSPPAAAVDVRTMDRTPPPGMPFMPARYALITGDRRLSPNNDYEVKALTNSDNKDGHKIKVILISRAGSEGTDFKFIRQVHILDPWFNMNRIEQIVGRAVRNFSHKDLPLLERNVEIYMHGTILSKNIEEAADLYVYRLAEYKAVQIGKLTRVLKETAVDCLLHHDQTNFTQTKMDIGIRQQLSNGEILEDFRVGDAPFSPACDYMPSCDYHCRPNAVLDEAHANRDTYDESYALANLEAILRKIRFLFQEEFFYQKEKLINAVNIPKKYPLIQIYFALSHLVNSDNEFIVDKYKRNGRLVNVGEYYLFQPLELANRNASIYDRSMPIDYKHKVIQFDLKEGVVTAQKNTLPDIPVVSKGRQLMQNMADRFDVVKANIGQKMQLRGDKDWEKHCSVALMEIQKRFPGDVDIFFSFVVAHLIEELQYDEKVTLMNYLYSLDMLRTGTAERYSKDYFEKNTFQVSNLIVFLAYTPEKEQILLYLSPENTWLPVDLVDKELIDRMLPPRLAADIEHCNSTVGFMGHDTGDGFVFKTKRMGAAATGKDKGARCSQASRKLNLVKLNDILGTEGVFNLSTDVSNLALCTVIEFVMRLFDERKHNGKRWFFTPEMALYYGFSKQVSQL